MKYLFKALLKDGTTIEQTQEDKSTTTEGKNAFYDVLQNTENLRAFALYNQETQEEYLVDLVDGRFEANGASFFMHDEQIQNIRLIYFKRNFLIVNLPGNPELTNVTYHFGFQANTVGSGANLQRVMVLY